MTSLDRLRQDLGEDVRADVLLAPFTTFRTGGPAELFIETRSGERLAAAVRAAHAAGVPFTVLGGGSNVLVADRGIHGLVIRPRGGTVTAMADGLVRADAALTINGLVRWTIAHGWAGIEAWAGTPGSVGGAIYGNAHFRGTNISELVASVRLVKHDGTILQVPGHRMGFDYDDSRLKHSGEVVVWAAFHLEPGHPSDGLRATARASLAYRKKTQPLEAPSAGCIFMNPDPAHDSVPPDIPPSAGALVDRAGMKGIERGGAMVSPTHANFIVNTGSATSAAIRALINECRDAVRTRFGVTLREEIVYLGDF